MRGTVRNAKDTVRLEPIKEEFGDLWNELDLVEADLLNKESLKAAIEGWTYVIHVASPVPLYEPEDENEVIKPAVEGTKDIFRACQEAGVSRIVITSSISAIEDFNLEECNEYTELPLNEPWVNAYRKSKYLADKCVWEMVNEKDNKLEAISLLPGLITGPVFLKNDFTSKKAIQVLLEEKYPFWPEIYISCVDVRDCAQAHLNALTWKKNIK